MIKFPANLLEPIGKFLRGEMDRLRKREKQMKEEDPFMDADRGSNNSLEEDVDEQLGHFDSEMKTRFVRRQILQFKKALTMMKLGKYGICEKCGKMIDTDRLAVNPETTVCVSCAKELD